jgi:hypothetical protein
MSPHVIGPIVLTALLVAAPIGAQEISPAASSASFPDDGRILGIVVDDDNKPVAGALVFLSDGRSTETAPDGRFSFLRVRPGSHEIAAVTKNCAVAAGDFDVHSGKDSMLQLIVVAPAAENKDLGRGTAVRRMTGEALLALGNRSALEAVEELAPNVFEVSGNHLVLRTRTLSAPGRDVEPLLILDGVRMHGMVAEALRGMRASDLLSLELHLGNAAGWEFQNNGAEAVIEVKMRTRPIENPLQNPQMCFGRKG